MSTTTQQSAPPQDRGARIIQKAIELMAAGRARGWSDALARARAEIRD